MPGSIPAHAFPWPLLSLPHCRAQAVATRSPGMPIFSVRLNSFLAHKLLAPLPSGTVAPPQKLPHCSTLQAEAARIFFLFSALCCPANPAHRRYGREGDWCTEQWMRRRRRNSLSPASGCCALLSSQRGLSGAPLTQVLHSSPRDSPPSRGTDRRTANGEARLSCI